MSLESVCTLAKGNKTNPNYKGVRIVNGTVMATDVTMAMKGENIPQLNGIDCYVDAETFLQAWSGTKQPKVTLTETLLKIEEGKYSAELMLMDPTQFTLDPTAEPVGDSVEPKDFLEAIKRVSKFLAVTGARGFIGKGYIYVTDTNFLVRTPCDTPFPEQTESPLTINQQFADIVTKLKKDAQEIRVTEKNLSVLFEDAWVEAVRWSDSLPADFDEWFAENAKYEQAELPEDVMTTLKHVCASCKGEDKFNFSPMGITLMQAGKVSYNIKHPMPIFSIRADWLKTIIEVGKKFNFETQKTIIFTGEGIEGVWSTEAFSS